jgi:hypothetical protein
VRGYLGQAMFFLQGLLVGLAVAWAPALVLMSYLIWRTSRDRCSVRTSLTPTSQSGRAKVLGPIRARPHIR